MYSAEVKKKVPAHSPLCFTSKSIDKFELKGTEVLTSKAVKLTRSYCSVHE